MNTIPNNSAVDAVNVSELNVKNNVDTHNNKKIEQAVVKERETSEKTEPVKKEVSVEQLEVVAQQLQDFVGEMNKGLEFLVDKDSGRDVIKVVDKNNGDIIKQYPTEEVLDLVSKLSDATGSFVNEEV